MNKILLLSLLTLILFSCGDKNEQSVEDILSSNNLTEIRAKKVEISALHSAYEEQIELLSELNIEL